jgi:small-conductance mechanosensitive channel
MVEILAAVWANNLYRKLILSIIILLIAIALRHLLHLLIVTQLHDESPHLYTDRRVTKYMVNILATLMILGIWVQHVADLLVALGILAAGLAFALQEVIGSIAGCVTIITGQPFTIGDRVETGGI